MNLLALTSNANSILIKLAQMGAKPWTSELAQLYPNESDLESNVQVLSTLIEKRQPQNSNFEPSLIVGSLTAISAQTMPTYLPSARRDVFTHLKQHHRIIQIGGGRGRGILIINGMMIPNPTEKEIIASYIDPTDSVSIAKAMQNITRDNSEDTEALLQIISGLEEDLQMQTRKVEELSSELNARFQTTWT